MLTKRLIDVLKPREEPFIVFDGKLPGFGVRVAPTGRMSFIVEYRPHGGGRGVAKKRLTLGAYGPLTVEEARAMAKEALARVRLGEDPPKLRKADNVPLLQSQSSLTRSWRSMSARSASLQPSSRIGWHSNG